MLYDVIRQHPETYLALGGEDDRDDQRARTYVEPAFRSYLDCGILAFEFAGARCVECGEISKPPSPAGSAGCVRLAAPCPFGKGA